jgi:hypothetical protein
MSFATARGCVMRKNLVFGAVVACAAMLGATIGLAADGAEAPSDSGPEVASPLVMGRSLANAPYLRPTGETVPRPGLPPSGDQAGQDRQIHDRNDLLIRKGICSNC